MQGAYKRNLKTIAMYTITYIQNDQEITEYFNTLIAAKREAAYLKRWKISFKSNF